MNTQHISDEDAAPPSPAEVGGVERLSTPSPPARNGALTILTIGATLVLVWWLRPVLTPIAIAWLGKVALTPIVRWGRSRGIAPSVSAAILVAVLLAGFGGAAVGLSEPAQAWIERLPDDIDELKSRWDTVGSSTEEVAEVVDAVDDLVETSTADIATPVRVVDTTPLVLRAFEQARGVLAQFLVFVVLLFFMLANDRVLMRKWVSIAKTPLEKERARSICSSIETQCSRYLLSITVINAGLGAAVGIALAILDVPNPLLWGAGAAVLNFIPFAGAAVGIAVVLVVGVSSSTTVIEGVMPALSYLVLTGVEGLLVTPAIVGRSIRLSPVAVVIWLLIWGWLWGLAGALLAVPLLSALAIVGRHVPGWAAIATLVDGKAPDACPTEFA